MASFSWPWSISLALVVLTQAWPPGFGVGSFHFQAQLKELSRSHRVYAVDLVGQGKSWPSDIDGLQFSAQLWASQARGPHHSRLSAPRLYQFPEGGAAVYVQDDTAVIARFGGRQTLPGSHFEQVEDFIRDVIKEPSFLVGNSLGVRRMHAGTCLSHVVALLTASRNALPHMRPPQWLLRSND